MRSLTPIRALLLDKDGTLIDFYATWTPINREAALFAAGGDPALAEDLMVDAGFDRASGRVKPGSALAGGGVAQIAEIFARRLGSRTPPRLEAEINRIFGEGGGRYAVLIEGTREAIAAYRRLGLRLAVATNDSYAGLESSLGRHDLLDVFEFLVGCDSGHGPKPGPGMVTAFCTSSGLAPGEVAVVGDGLHDLHMAHAAGAGLAVGVLSGTCAMDDLAPHADFVTENVLTLAGDTRLLDRLPERRPARG